MANEKKRELLENYAERRTLFKLEASDLHGCLLAFLSGRSPVYREQMFDRIKSGFPSVATDRATLARMNDEFSENYGQDLHQIFSDAERGKGIYDPDYDPTPRTKDEIMSEYLKCQDFYATSDYMRSIVSCIDNDTGYHGNTKVDMSDVKSIEQWEYSNALKREWELTYPDADFDKELAEAQKSYYDEQRKELKKYIDSYKAISMFREEADFWASERNGISDYRSTLKQIKKEKDNQKEMADCWKEKYGTDIETAVTDYYDEIYPDDDFEWYSGDFDENTALEEENILE